MANYIRNLNFLKKNKKRNLKKKGEIILQRTKPYKVQFYESVFLLVHFRQKLGIKPIFQTI